MYDDLVKRLRELHPKEFGDAWDFAFACQQAMHEAADAIEAMCEMVATAHCELANVIQSYEESKPRWIPVTERLPEDFTRVIVFCEDGDSYGFCEHLIADDEEVVEWHDLLHYPITPTHWMPRLEPPKGE